MYISKAFPEFGVQSNKFLKSKQSPRRVNYLPKVTHSGTHRMRDETKRFRPPMYPPERKLQ